MAGIAFVVAKLVAGREEFAAAVRQSDPAWLLASGAAGMAAIVGIGANWVAIMRTRGVRVGWAAGLRWFCVGQLGKYVPGGIWPVVGQGEMARRGGVARPDAYAATVTSMAATLLGAATVAAITGLLSPGDRQVLGLALGLAVAGVFALLGLAPLRRRADGFLQRTSRGRIALPRAASLARWTLLHVPVWLAFGVANCFAVIALNGPRDSGFVVDLVFVTCVSWMAGFVIIGLPGGIGVREAVFVSLMTAPLGAGLAVTVAVVSRLVSILVDVVAAGGSVLVVRITGDRHAGV